MSLSDKNISKKSKLARHIQAALVGGVTLSAGLASSFPASADALTCLQNPDHHSCSSGGGSGGSGSDGGSTSQPTAIDTFTTGHYPDTSTGQDINGSAKTTDGDDKLELRKAPRAGSKLDGLGGNDELSIWSEGGRIDLNEAGVIAGFETLKVETSAGTPIKINYAQHNAFEQVIITNNGYLQLVGDAQPVIAQSGPSTYKFGDPSTITVKHKDIGVYGSSGDDVLIIDTALYTRGLNLSGGNDTLHFKSSVKLEGDGLDSRSFGGIEKLVFDPGVTVEVSPEVWYGIANEVVSVDAPGEQTLKADISGRWSLKSFPGIEHLELSGCDRWANFTVGYDFGSIRASDCTESSAVITFDSSGSATGEISGFMDVSVSADDNREVDITGLQLPGVNVIRSITARENSILTMSTDQIGPDSYFSARSNSLIKLQGDGDADLSEAPRNNGNFEILDETTDTRIIKLPTQSEIKVSAKAETDANTFKLHYTFNGSYQLTGNATNPDTLLVSGHEIDFDNLETSDIDYLDTDYSSTTKVKLTSDELSKFKRVRGLKRSVDFYLNGGGVYDWQNLAFVNMGKVYFEAQADTTLILPDLTVNQEVTFTDKLVVTNQDSSQAQAANITLDASRLVSSPLHFKGTRFDGDDTVTGGALADIIEAGGGQNTLTGGAGADEFRGNASDLDGDTITDLAHKDVITLSDTHFAQGQSDIAWFDGDNVLKIDTGSSSNNNVGVISLNIANDAGQILSAQVKAYSPLSIEFIRPNTAPKLTNLPNSLPYTENADPVSIAPQAHIVDIDLDEENNGLGNYAGTTLSVSRAGGADSTDVFANLGDLGSLITGQPLVYQQQVVGTVINNAQGELKLSFNSNATTAIATSVLRSISYQSSSEHPDESIALKITFNDGKADNTGNSQVNFSVTRLNDAPTDITWALESGVTLPLKQSLLGEYNISNPGALLTLSATDVDMTDNHTFTLVYSGQGAQGCDNTTTSKSFSINGNVLYVRKDAEPKEHPVCVTATDSAGAIVRKKLLINIIDDVAPSVDSVSFSRDSYGDGQKRNVAFKFHGATDSAFDYTYVISSENGGEVTANGQYALASSSQNKNIDLSGLQDGKITLSVTLRDSKGNSSAPFTTTAILDTTAPNGFNAALNKTLFNEQSAAQASFDISAAEVGAQFNYTITSSNGGPAVTGSGTIESATQSISPVDLRGLNDGELTLSVTLTDVAGNTSAAQTSFARLDSGAPGIATFRASLAKLNKDGTAVVDIVLAEPSDDFDISDLEAAGGTLTGFTKLSPTVYQVTYVPAVNSSTAGSLKIKAGAFTDAAGNTNTAAPVLNFDIDTQAPNQPNVVVSGTAFNADTIKDGLFRLLGAEQGATYQWTMQSLSGRGAINTAEQVIRFDSDSSGIQNMNDGTLSLSVTVIDDHGNESQPFTQDIVYENVKPTLQIIAPQGVSGKGPVTLEFVVSEEITGFEQSDLQVNAGYFQNFQELGNNRYSAQYVAAPQASGAVTVSVADGAFKDKAGNKVAATEQQFDVDTLAPAGHSVAMNMSQYHSQAVGSASFSFTNAEVGANYTYTLTSSGGGKVSGSGTINSATDTVNILDMRNLKDGSLMLNVILTDSAGNQSGTVSDSAYLDTVAPQVQTITASSTTLKASETSVITITLSETSSDFSIASLAVSGGELSGFTALNGSATDYQVTFIPTAGTESTGSVTVKASAFKDQAGNVNSETKSVELNIDTQAPTGYAVTLDKDVYNSSASSIRFDLSGGEAGATYTYTLSSDGRSVSGTGTLDSAQQQVVITDIENLNDGPLSLSVTLTDKAGNAGVAAMDTATLDTVAPSGHDITLDQQTYNLANRDAASFSFSGAEVGATYAYTLTSTGGGELTGTDTITAANQQVNIANLSQLKDGMLSLSVVLTDSAGNAAAALTKQAKLDATAPTITTLSASQTALKAGETSVITIGLSEAVVDFNKALLNVAGGTVSELEQISDTSYRTVFTPSENSQAAGTIAIAAGKFNDAAGNPNQASDTLTLNIDTQAPGNHSVAFGAPYYHGTNANAASITLGDAEVGTRYHYVISSTQGGLPVSAQGDVTESNQTISGINLSNLNDGQLNVTVTLTDPAGNVSEVASGTAILDTAAPQVVSLTSNDLALKAGEQAQITIVLSEPSADFTMEDIVASSGSLSEFKALNATTYQATFTPDESAQGEVTISIAAGVFNDAAGNANMAAQPLVLSQDTTAPSGQSVSIDQTLINRDNETAMSFTLSGLEGKGMLTYQVSDGTTSVGSQSPISITAATQSVTGVDVSALAEGRLILTVVVYDEANNAGEPVTAAVTKKYNVAPVLSGTPQTTVNEDAEYVFEPQLTDSDSDDTHTFVISNKPDWASFDEQTGKLSGTPGDEHVGNYEQIVITVNDGKAEHALSAFNIEVVNTNDAPVAQDFSFTLNEAELLVIASQQGLLSNATDDDLDSEDSLSAVVVSQPQYGTLLLNADGSFTYTHDGSENHSDSFTYQVKDAAGELSQTRNVALTINPLADAPVTLDDTLTVTEDTPNTLDLLENDSDAENDMVAASAAVVTEPLLGSYTITNGKLTYTPNENATGQDTLTYTVKDAAGNTSKAATLTISIVAVNDQPVAKGATLTVEEDTPSNELDVRTLSSDIEDTHPQGEVALSVLPTKGVVTVNQESGKLVYTPNANATGSDAFSYTIADSEGLVSEPVEVIVNIGAVNDRPVADGDSVTLNEDEAGTLNILDNDTDVEDQGFNGANVMLEDKGNGAGAYELADVTVLADGQLEITPKADVNGSFSFTYTLMDSEGLSSEPATVNVDITPVNDAPVATDNTAQLEEEGSYEVNVLGDDYDVDANDQLDPSSVTVVAQPQSGRVTVTDSGAIVYVPNAHFNGLDTFTYTVKDAAGAVSNEALVTMTVTPVNDAPVADAQVLNVAEDGSVLITLTATDIDADALSYQIVQGVNSGTLTQQSDNSWLYTPDTDFNGEDSLQFVAFDGQAESEPVQVTLNVTAMNDAPVITGTPATGVDQDAAYRFTPDATDLDGDLLTFSIENQPVWANFDAQSGTLSGTPGRDDVGNYANIVISVSDGELTASLPAFAIDVGYVNAKPVAQTMQVFVDEDASTSFSAPVTDPDQDSLSITVTQQPASGTLSVQGTLFSYIPGANFNGSDSFSYVVNDGEMNSDEARVSITVNAVNDTPVAQNDAFSFGDVASSYSLDVLANDSDVDAGDTLTLVGASASIGSVSISDGQLVYQPQASAQDTAVITYMLADSAGARAQATATVEITASAAANAPTLSVPNDMSVDATGLFTKVDLGTASAFDSNGNPLAVSLVDGVTIFAPGLHQVYWKATDGNDQSTVKKQTVAVNPLVSLSKDSQIAEEQSHTVKVFLNGPAPSYPVTVPYTVTGSADGNDHDLLDGEVVIESGTEASITFNVFADGIAEGNERIVITLADTLNRGAKSSSTVTIVEDNVAPALTVNTTQSGESRTLVLQNGEPVVVSAVATDANPQDSITLSWEAADAQMTDLSFEAGRFEFDPSVLTAGIYKLSVTATDDGTPALSATQDIYLEVVESLPQLSGVDSDGDLIPDDQEGFADSDNDGIPDYLDANSDCNVIPGQVKDANQYLVEGEPGVCLRKGATVAQNATGGAQLLETELPVDSEATNIGGVFDFIATGLPKAGDVYGIVIPQRKPIPVNAIYRKFRDGEWVNFVTTDGNAILSATGEPGYCPPPGSNEWRDGLNEGDWCVQLQIVDGGPNDDDGIANRSIVDPGGIAVLMSDNTQPVAQADTLTVGAGLPVFINVLENDSDADGDTLTITGASADFGEVEILDNQLRYTPPVDYVGTATINYSIADGQGGTSSATVTVELVVNAAPVTQLDTASTHDQASVILDVLANDMDPDGDALTLISATATHGKAVVNLDGTLSYEPKLGFNGEDTVTYQVKDAKGATSTGIAKIKVTAHQVATVENKSSGSLGGLLIVMVSALVLRRRKSALPAYAVVTASCLISAPALADAWRVQATLGQAEANSQFSALPAGTQVSNVDDSSQSWSAGAFYQLMPKWYAGLRYIDLGQGRVTLSGSTLTPDSWHESMARVAPVLPEGFALQTGLEVARFDKVHGELFLGAYNWDYQIDSTLNGRHFVQYEQKGTSAYFGGAVGYQLSDSTVLTLSYSHYRLSANRIGEVAAGIEVRF
ncbi:tandem-95 repeat protein [Pseudoalteromonas rubra]|uniref:tandem-95 repeat protein n=1 Tax=Pseudoalteromonas rubra TaxID=43658 RepID=UPI000F7A4EDD|nr:tandem-95 repeat protein [Pseudoalteromonas rubra]